MTETAASYRARVGAEVRHDLLPEASEHIDRLLQLNREDGNVDEFGRRDAKRCFRNARKILEEAPDTWWADQAHRTPHEVVRRVVDRILPYYA